MLYYKDDKWNFCNEKIKYIQDGGELENYIGQEGKDWWLDLIEREVIELVEYINISLTEVQLTRLDEINKLGINDGHSEVLSNYVIDGNFPSEVNHILKDFESKLSNIQQGVSLSEREINEIMFGMQISDIEIQLLELGGI